MYNTPPKGYNYTFLNSYSPYHNQVFLAPIRLAYEPLALASYTLPPFPPPFPARFATWIPDDYDWVSKSAENGNMVLRA